MFHHNLHPEELLKHGAQLLDIPVSQDKLNLLVQYCLELDKWNRKINLIAKDTSIPASLEKHFLDSLTLLPVIQKYSPPEPTLLDIGTGAGFPGLVLKTIFPKLDVTLVEPRQKRSIFLRHIIRMLYLHRIQVKTGRIEDLNLHTAVQKYSFITSRALTEPAQFLHLINTLLAPETIIILMQSRTDLDQWFTAELQEQFTLLDHISFCLPFSKSKRQLILLRLR
jgi:16S rRNA (guanine527-N7)-methyltransferase